MHRRPVVKDNTNHSVGVYCIKSNKVGQNLNGFFALSPRFIKKIKRNMNEEAFDDFKVAEDTTEIENVVANTIVAKEPLS